ESRRSTKPADASLGRGRAPDAETGTAGGGRGTASGAGVIGSGSAVGVAVATGAAVGVWALRSSAGPTSTASGDWCALADIAVGEYIVSPGGAEWTSAGMLPIIRYNFRPCLRD